MTDPLGFPEITPMPAIHNAPPMPLPEFPFTPGQLIEVGFQLIEQFLKNVALALAKLIPGGGQAFEVLSDWADSVNNVVQDFFQSVVDIIQDIFGGIFGGLNFGDLPTPGEVWDNVFGSVVNIGSIPQNIVSGLQGALNELNDWITDIIVGIGNVLDDIPIVGRDLEAALLRLFNVRQKAVTADARSTQIVEDVTAAWANDTPTGTPTPVFDTVVAIRESFINGYTVLTFTSNDTWTVPAGLTELWYIVIGGGGRGENGGLTTTEGTLASGGAGGSSGGYLAQQIDPSTLTVGATVPVTVGAAGATSGADGGLTSIGSVSVVRNTGAISSPFGYSTSASKPGVGGAGGDARTNGAGNLASDGTAGEPSAAAAGGTAGSGGTGSGGNAGHGANASVTAPTKCGGGGGGGGGGRRNGSLFQAVTAGDGGNGGYPGGGSGGGGAVSNPGGGATSRGTAGIPGNGIAFIMFKAAA